LIKILAGYHAPDPGGSIKIDGSDANLDSPPVSHAAGLRFVHQDLGLVGSLTAVENLALGRGFHTGLARRILWKRERLAAQEMLGALGFNFDVNVPVSDLTAAERTGVAIARALGDQGGAKLLVVDEPTATLPRAEVQMLFGALSEVRQRGVGVIYVSHRLDELFSIADRVTVLKDGARVMTRALHDLDHDSLVSAMVGAAVEHATAEEAATGGRVVLQVTNLTGRVLRPTNFLARRGEILGIAGLTGSGREEILSLVFGSQLSRGVVSVDGHQVRAVSPFDSIRHGLAFVPADRRGLGSIVSLSVRENCTIADLQRNAYRGVVIRSKLELTEVEHWLESLDVRPRDPNSPFATLSGGNQQKVVLSKWLRLKPRALLVDEPTQGVDVGAKVAIHALLRKVASEGAAVVVTSSEDSELATICDRVLVLQDGNITAEVSGDGLTSDELARLQLSIAAS
jgi:ribose transport system ATP-binding protein